MTQEKYIKFKPIRLMNVLFFKHAFEKTNGSKSWLYQFSEKDKEFLKECHDKRIPTFIYLLCCVNGLKDSEIAVLKFEEFKKVINKGNFTIALKERSRSFDLKINKSPKNDMHIPRGRIQKTFDELINEVVLETNGYYCPNCGTIIHL